MRGMSSEEICPDCFKLKFALIDRLGEYGQIVMKQTRLYQLNDPAGAAALEPSIARARAAVTEAQNAVDSHRHG
jgi:hypothetical protein